MSIDKRNVVSSDVTTTNPQLQNANVRDSEAKCIQEAHHCQNADATDNRQVVPDNTGRKRKFSGGT